MPLLIAHGDNNPRVPVYEARQLYDRLQSLGKPVEILTFPDEGHGFRKENNRITFAEKLAASLSQHLKAGGNSYRGPCPPRLFIFRFERAATFRTAGYFLSAQVVPAYQTDGHSSLGQDLSEFEPNIGTDQKIGALKRNAITSKPSENPTTTLTISIE